jgi:hypothetical protein
MGLLAAAGVPVVPIVASTAAAATGDDTFERIAEHRRLAVAIHAICERIGELEEQLPDDRQRHFYISDRGTDVGKDDDPRWTKVQSEYWTAEDLLDEIAWSFVDRPPSTAAGCGALLKYAVEYEKRGHEWPDCRHHFSESGQYLGFTEENWQISVMNVTSGVLASVSQ